MYVVHAIMKLALSCLFPVNTSGKGSLIAGPALSFGTATSAISMSGEDGPEDGGDGSLGRGGSSICRGGSGVTCVTVWAPVPSCSSSGDSLETSCSGRSCSTYSSSADWSASTNSSDVPDCSPSDSLDVSMLALNDGRVCGGSGFDGPATGVGGFLSSSGTCTSGSPGV